MNGGGRLLNDSTGICGLGGATLSRLVGSILLTLLVSPYALSDGASETYKAKCSACHGAHGAGDTMIGRNLKLRPLSSSEVQNRSDEELFTVISKGKNKMPSFDKKLSPDQIHDLIHHIRSLKK